jgi:hypothetical protein
MNTHKFKGMYVSIVEMSPKKTPTQELKQKHTVFETVNGNMYKTDKG